MNIISSSMFFLEIQHNFMTLLSLLDWSTIAVNKVRMHIITVSVTVSSIKIQLLMILKKGLQLTELEKKKRFSEKQ